MSATLSYSAFFRQSVETTVDSIAADLRNGDFTRTEAKKAITNEVFEILRCQTLDPNWQIRLKALATIDSWLESDLYFRKQFPAMPNV